VLIWIFAAGAVVCLAYLLVIILYSGIGTDSAWIWLMFAAVLGAASFSSFRFHRHPEQVALRLPVTLVTLCGAGLIILLLLQIMMFGRIPAVAEPVLDYVIVLGAQVKPEGPSRTLKLRLDKAAEYALQNPETMLVLSGGQGANEPQSEAAAMQEYLLEQGVPKDRMFLEMQSTSTMENMVFSWSMIRQEYRRIQEQEMWRRYGYPGPEDGPGANIVQSQDMAPPVRIGVLTSNFHLYRATKIAQKQGISDVRGIAAGSDPVLLLHFAIRDALAILKDRLAGNL